MSGGFLLLLYALVASERVRRRPADLPLAIAVLVLGFAGVLAAGPRPGLIIPLLDWGEAWALETVIAIGVAAWLLADRSVVARPRIGAFGSPLRLVKE